MAIQTSGTTRISNAGQLQNITSVDTTSSNSIKLAAGVVVVKSGYSTATSALTLQYNHGQGSRPDFVYGELNITTAQHGYAVGDTITVTNIFERDETDYILSFWGNTTKIGYAMNAVQIYREIAQRETGADLQLTGQRIRVVGVWYAP